MQTKTFISLMTSTLFIGAAASATAQDALLKGETALVAQVQDVNLDVTSQTQTSLNSDAMDMFASADVNADKSLDREEFVTFALLKAGAGDSYFSMIREKGAYDSAFNTHDADANARLDKEELSARLEPMTAEEGAIKLPSVDKKSDFKVESETKIETETDMSGESDTVE
ncbi:hypothetical protein DES40_1642 [Litorimonas taeanensis]|uniref:EF-hand domain-containing protein n=1 Tax=Litorimonas taeanensis TaxID=568099 RepID=A0A420WCW7_9PROT|nr:hypothetical protein [Litorimonas taeanensis]RKQ68867.1 hypothetical protein DES40_1642 [Litorimonas taeanensis]